MTAKGVHIHCDSRVQSIEKTTEGYSLRLDQSEILETDLVMYATGRRPNTAGLGLEAAGVALNANGAVAVDAYSRTACESIYAIGDVTDRVNLTPVALAEGMAVVETLFGKAPVAMDYANIPSAVFSQPPERGRLFSQVGKMANRVKGSAKASEKPSMPTTGATRSPRAARRRAHGA